MYLLDSRVPLINFYTYCCSDIILLIYVFYVTVSFLAARCEQLHSLFLPAMLLPSSALLFLGLLTWNPNLSHAAKVMVVPPIMFESHLYIFKTLAAALHKKGHEVHFLVSEGREVPPAPHYHLQRYPGLFNSSTADSFLQTKVGRIFSGHLTFLELFELLDHYAQNCDAVIGNAEVVARLRAEKFDLMLVDANEMCGFLVAHIMGVKYATISTGLWFPAEAGAPTPLSYVPEFNSMLTDHMSLGQRIANTVVYVAQRFGIRFILLPKYEWIMHKHNVKPVVSLAQLIQDSQMWMICTDIALEFPRPTLPHVVYIGGILTKPANPLPQVSRINSGRAIMYIICYLILLLSVLLLYILVFVSAVLI